MAFASFSSGGPRTGDSSLKPDITAPGLSIFSTDSGTGNGGMFNSGTSMASPHVAGVAALTRQAHPTWKVEDIKAAIVNTGLPSGVALPDEPRRYGPRATGRVDQVAGDAPRPTTKFTVGVNFGFEELKDDFARRRRSSCTTTARRAATFNVAQAIPQGSPHTVNFNKTSSRCPRQRATPTSR